MDNKTVTRELAEEIRTNTALRHRLGMEEGSEMSYAEDGTKIWFSAATGESFTLNVEDAK